jgi:hypothetical protein
MLNSSLLVLASLLVLMETKRERKPKEEEFPLMTSDDQFFTEMTLANLLFNALN